MGNYYILNKKEAVSANATEWAQWFEEADRRVADEMVGDVRISTVFLGLNHQWGDGPPLLFETMVFGGKFDEDQWRYSTWEEAEKGHTETVEKVRANL